MKKINISIVIGISILCFVQCKKEKIDEELEIQDLNEYSIEWDTIFPSAYFPAYPGSYWMYNQNDRLEVHDEYEIYDRIYHPEGQYDSTYILMPKLIAPNFFGGSNLSQYISKNKISDLSSVNCGLGSSMSFRTFYTTNVGNHERFTCDLEDTRGIETIALDTTLEINNVLYDSVLVAIYYFEYLTSFESLSKDSIWYVKDCFAKNIGLVKREMREPLFRQGEIIGYEDERTYTLKEYSIHRPGGQ